MFLHSYAQSYVVIIKPVNPHFQNPLSVHHLKPMETGDVLMQRTPETCMETDLLYQSSTPPTLGLKYKSCVFERWIVSWSTGHLRLLSPPWLHPAVLQMTFHALCVWKYCVTQRRLLVVTPTAFSASRSTGIKLLQRASTPVLSVDRCSNPGHLWEETTCWWKPWRNWE